MLELKLFALHFILAFGDFDEFFVVVLKMIHTYTLLITTE